MEGRLRQILLRIGLSLIPGEECFKYLQVLPQLSIRMIGQFNIHCCDAWHGCPVDELPGVLAARLKWWVGLLTHF